MKRFLLFLIIPLTVLVLYYPVIFTYFSQDDFFHFKVSLTDGSIHQFINLFGFHPFSERGIAFYRPIFREGLFNIFYSLFQLNPYPFRILQFLILFVNSFLIYVLIKNIFKKKILSFFVAFFYSISASQIAPLYYLAGGIQVLGTTFFTILSLIYWGAYLSKKGFKYKIFSLITFILALGSHELAVISPFLIIGLSTVIQGLKKSFSHLKYFFLLLLITIIYLLLEFTLIGYSKAEQQYQAIFNFKQILNSYMWYSGWALGIPEMLVDFILPGFKLNPSLMKYWGNYYKIIFPTFFVSLFLIFSSAIYLVIKNKTFFFTFKNLFFLFWFIISLLPVIFLPSHKSTQYLELGLVGFWTLVGLIFTNTYYKIQERSFSIIYLSIFILSLFILQISSIFLQRTTYWAAQRGNYAKRLISQITNLYPTLPKGAIIYLENDPKYPFVATEWGSSSKQAAFILNNQDAIQLIYKDPTIQVYYEDLIKPPSNILQDKIITIKAEIY